MTKGCLTLLAATIALLLACSKEPPRPAPRQRVRVALAAFGPASPPINVTGRLASKDEVPLSFKVSGIVARFAVDEGSRVVAGQVLAELTRTEINAGLAQSREVSSKAARDLARAEQLFADDVITREQLDDARTAAAVSRAALRATAFNAAYAAIRAPGNGVVLRREAEAGQLVAAGTPILLLSGERAGWVVRASIADRDIVNLRVGDSAELRFDAYPGKIFAATVSQITPAADQRLGTFDFEARVDAGGATLVSGLVAKLRIAPKAGASPLVHIPLDAVLEADQLAATVFTVTPASRAQRRNVSIDYIASDSVALRSGIAAGEAVITDGLAYVHDGAAVDVIRP
jgi:membrane fusion protein, multidrug efflux system